MVPVCASVIMFLFFNKGSIEGTNCSKMCDVCAFVNGLFSRFDLVAWDL